MTGIRAPLWVIGGAVVVVIAFVAAVVLMIAGSPPADAAPVPTPTPAVASGGAVTAVPSGPLVRDRGIPYYVRAEGVPTVVYEPVGDEIEVRFEMQVEKAFDAPFLAPVVYDRPDDLLTCRIHGGNGGIVHVTAVRPGGTNYYAVPA